MHDVCLLRLRGEVRLKRIRREVLRREVTRSGGGGPKEGDRKYAMFYQLIYTLTIYLITTNILDYHQKNTIRALDIFKIISNPLVLLQN